MLRKSKWLVGGLSILLLLLSSFLYEQHTRARATMIAQIDYCAHVSKQTIDCSLALLRTAFETDGIEAAFQTFEIIYQRNEAFANSGCHLYAHRIGDMAYYQDYIKHHDLNKVQLPKSTISCGYGFYHGFIEHMAQDNPDITFMTDVCTRLKTRLTDMAPAIGKTCYHGVGHGFVLAKADEALDPLQWDFNFFTDDAIRMCDELPAVTSEELFDCRQGVYNIVVNWMENEEYGFRYNPTTPFIDCDTKVSALHQEACYYEISRKISGLVDGSLQKGITLIQTGARSEFQLALLSIVVSGLVQNDPDGTGPALLAQCRTLDEAYRPTCIRSIVGGQFEHGTPGAEYEIAQQFCTDEPMSEEEQGYCLERFAHKLRRFRNSVEIDTLCRTGILNETVCTYLVTQNNYVTKK